MEESQQPIWPKVLFGLGALTVIISLVSIPGAARAEDYEASIAVILHGVVLGGMLMFSFDWGESALWPARLLVGMVIATVMLGFLHGIDNVLHLALLALAVAVLYGVVEYAVNRTVFSYTMAVAVVCVVLGERVIAAGGSGWLATGAVLGWLLLNLIAAIVWVIRSDGETEQPEEGQGAQGAEAGRGESPTA